MISFHKDGAGIRAVNYETAPILHDLWADN